MGHFHLSSTFIHRRHRNSPFVYWCIRLPCFSSYSDKLDWPFRVQSHDAIILKINSLKKNQSNSSLFVSRSRSCLYLLIESDQTDNASLCPWQFLMASPLAIRSRWNRFTLLAGLVVLVRYPRSLGINLIEDADTSDRAHWCLQVDWNKVFHFYRVYVVPYLSIDAVHVIPVITRDVTSKV